MLEEFERNGTVSEDLNVRDKLFKRHHKKLENTLGVMAND
jgi:hypothetical protein